jgi:hypothetical protein
VGTQLFSDTAKGIKKSHKIDLVQLFLSEAKQHLEVEGGKVTLTTVQGLYVLNLVAHYRGCNRAGSMYRLEALDMLSRLTPEKVFERPWIHEQGEADKRRALSKTCWGIICIEW